MYFFHERWPVFYEDNHLLVVYKPAGLIMQRDHKNKANLLDLAKIWIKNRYNKPGNVFAGMVHRLDGPVAGVVVVARTSKAASRLSAQIREREIEKRYLAVVTGHPPKIQDRLEDHLKREGRKSAIVAAGTSGSQKATLKYRVLSTRPQTCLLEIELETGRRHQIRAQLSHMGCPIYGDINYGASRPMPHGRIALLAHRLAFKHPTRAIRMDFESPVPMEWPWRVEEQKNRSPLWAVESYEAAGLTLPILQPAE